MGGYSCNSGKVTVTKNLETKLGRHETLEEDDSDSRKRK